MYCDYIIIYYGTCALYRVLKIGQQHIHAKDVERWRQTYKVIYVHADTYWSYKKAVRSLHARKWREFICKVVLEVVTL